MKHYYKIGPLAFSAEIPKVVTIPANFSSFEIVENPVEYEYEIIVVDDLPRVCGRDLKNNADFKVLETNDGECRYLAVGDAREGYYACYQELSGGKAMIAVRRSLLEGFQYDTVFTSLFALEKRMMEKNSYVLHCAYIEDEGAAVLFSAPSGVGKSTQADLWKTYRGSNIINGDHGLLSCYDGKWYAEGWPVCGTSEICHNIRTPLRCIVMLSQGKINKVQKLEPAKAFSAIYSQVTVNRWSSMYAIKAMDFIQKLVNEVPVYHLTCDISEEAVQILAAAIESV